MKLLLVLAGGVVVGIAAYLILVSNFIHMGTTKSNGIITNLRQIDAAKGQWAMEHHQTGAATPTRDDLAPYLGNPQEGICLDKPSAGEHYIIGSLMEKPFAELTRPLDGRPKGTILRLGTNWADQFVLPSPLR
jgi:hypothetical protein